MMKIPEVGESQSHPKPIIIIIAPMPTMINELSNIPVAGTVGVCAGGVCGGGHAWSFTRSWNICLCLYCC